MKYQKSGQELIRTDIGSERSLADIRDGASNVLLSSPSLQSSEATACTELLDVADPSELAVLGITYSRVTDRWLADFRRHFRASPALLQVVEGNGTTRGGAATAGHSPGPDGRRAVSVESPENLGGLAVQVADFLRMAESMREGREEVEVVVCFDSVTDLLQFADLPHAFRLLHVMTGRIRVAGATAHYHIHPLALDDGAVDTLAALFDGHARLDEDGSLDAEVE